MLHGYLPDVDLAIAATLRELDTDRRADRFGVFLESWRNGGESFYRALDRSAGSEDRLFFYDAMLSDFVRYFVPKKHSDYPRIRRSNKVAHDALHDSFLAYRQYRGMREALAVAMLLPPTAKLPGVLARYEAPHHKSYSFRQQTDLLLRVFDQDFSKVIELVNSSAAPLPDHLWTRPYDPWKSFHPAYDALMPKMLEIADHTDKVLKQQREIRLAIQARVAQAAWKALIDSGVSLSK